MRKYKITYRRKKGGNIENRTKQVTGKSKVVVRKKYKKKGYGIESIHRIEKGKVIVTAGGYYR